MIKTSVFCRTQFEGFHRWPKAADFSPEVSFLAFRHRHIFHVEAWVPVSHSDRDVEFILLKRRIDESIQEAIKGLDTMAWSCEDWAAYLVGRHGLSKCVVSEDGENGACVEDTDR